MKASQRIDPVFDDPNLVGSAGLVPRLRLAESAGLHDLLGGHLRVGSANPVAKSTGVVAGMLAGADSIDDLDLLRHGGMDRLFGGVRAPSPQRRNRSNSGKAGQTGGYLLPISTRQPASAPEIDEKSPKNHGRWIRVQFSHWRLTRSMLDVVSRQPRDTWVRFWRPRTTRQGGARRADIQSPRTDSSRTRGDPGPTGSVPLD